MNILQKLQDKKNAALKAAGQQPQPLTLLESDLSKLTPEQWVEFRDPHSTWTPPKNGDAFEQKFSHPIYSPPGDTHPQLSPKFLDSVCSKYRIERLSKAEWQRARDFCRAFDTLMKHLLSNSWDGVRLEFEKQDRFLVSAFNEQGSTSQPPVETLESLREKALLRRRVINRAIKKCTAIFCQEILQPALEKTRMAFQKYAIDTDDQERQKFIEIGEAFIPSHLLKLAVWFVLKGYRIPCEQYSIGSNPLKSLQNLFENPEPFLK